MKRTIKLIRRVVSLAAGLIGAVLFIASAAWSGWNAYGYYTYDSVAEGSVTGYYAPFDFMPDYKWPYIEYESDGEIYIRKGRSEVSARPYPDTLSISVRYDSADPDRSVTALDLYDGLKFSAAGLFIAFLFLGLSHLIDPASERDGGGQASGGGSRERYEGEGAAADPDTAKGHFNRIGPDLVYVLSPGNYASGWQQMDGEWYYFDPDNRFAAKRGCWEKLGGDMFCFSDSGAVVKGWYSDGKYWYLLNGSEANGRIGRLITGWVRMGEGGPLSYFNENDPDLPIGAMLTSCTAPGNIPLDENGRFYPAGGDMVPPGTIMERM